jgi:hypothetical protein
MLYKIDKNSKGITKTKRVPEGNKTKKAINRAARLSRDEDGEAGASAASSWGLPGTEAANPTEMARKWWCLPLTVSVWLVEQCSGRVEESEKSLAGVVGLSGRVLYIWIFWVLMRWRDLHPRHRGIAHTEGADLVVGVVLGFHGMYKAGQRGWVR